LPSQITHSQSIPQKKSPFYPDSGPGFPPPRKNTAGILFPLDRRPPIRKISEIQKGKRFTQPRKQTSTSKHNMKKIIPLIIALSLAGLGGASAQTNFRTIDSSQMNVGYMIVREATNNAFLFGTNWAFTNLTANYRAPNTLTMGPATSTNGLWYNPPGGGIDSFGNKTMQAWVLAQAAGLTGTLQFDGIVSAISLATNSAGIPYTATAFAREFGGAAPVISNVMALTSAGDFSISLPLSGLPGRSVQWGIILEGRNIWPEDTTQIANAGTITVVPEPSTYALLGLAAASGLLVRRFRRKA
jgi:hypothetical protein